MPDRRPVAMGHRHDASEGGRRLTQGGGGEPNGEQTEEN
jgi:hypothetical protein